MAGLGFKDFQVGEVLTSSDVDGYLMQQTVMRFADAGARGSALGTATGTAVPLAEGMVSYLDDTNRVEVYDGSAWKPVSNVVQTVVNYRETNFATTSTTLVDATDYDIDITPTSTSNRIIVWAMLTTGVNGAMRTFLRWKRDATQVGEEWDDVVDNNIQSAAQVVAYSELAPSTSSTNYQLMVRLQDFGGDTITITHALIVAMEVQP